VSLVHSERMPPGVVPANTVRGHRGVASTRQTPDCSSGHRRPRPCLPVDGDTVVGHLQIADAEGAAEAEVKNMAVAPSLQGRGLGRALMAAAIDLARREGRSALVVTTAAADTGNLRFYQRLGFRLRAVERDAFTAATGYARGLEVYGIELRDRVWLDLALVPARASRLARR